MIRDADGRLFRTPDVPGSLSDAGQRLVFDLHDAAAGDLLPSAPLALEGIELGIAPTDQVVIFGSAAVLGIEATDRATGDAGWTAVTVDGARRRLELGPAGRRSAGAVHTGSRGVEQGHDRHAPSRSSAASGPARPSGCWPGRRLPARIRSCRSSPRTRSWPRPEPPSATSSALSSLGAPLQARIVGTAALFAPLDPAKPFLLADLSSVEVVRYLTTGRTQQADEWWLSRPAGDRARGADRAPQPGPPGPRASSAGRSSPAS